MKNLLLLIIPSILLANVDMIMGDLDQDELVIGWVLNDTTVVAKYYDDDFHDQVFQPDHIQIALGLAYDDTGGKHVPCYFVETYNWAYRINVFAYDDLSLESEEDLYECLDGDTVVIGFLKSPCEEWDMVFGGGALQVTSTFTYIVALMMGYDINEDGTVEFGWLATQQVKLNKDLPCSGSESYWYPGQIAGPIACPGGYPLMVTSFGIIDDYYRTYAYSFDPDSTELPFYEFDFSSCTPEYSGVIALGSTSDTDALLLYSDYAGDVEIYEFEPFSPIPSYPSPFPWNSPDHNDPVAMTSTYELPGFLMVWYRYGQIMCRHWDNEWNAYDRIVASTGGTVKEGNIAVVSDTDGYWVAWLQNGAQEPDVVFVPYDYVTGFEEGSGSSDNISLVPLNNPFRGTMSFMVSGISAGTISVYDMSGRLVVSENVLREGIHQIDNDFSAGIYLIRLNYQSGEIACKMICI